MHPFITLSFEGMHIQFNLFLFYMLVLYRFSIFAHHFSLNLLQVIFSHSYLFSGCLLVYLFLFMSGYILPFLNQTHDVMLNLRRKWNYGLSCFAFSEGSEPVGFVSSRAVSPQVFKREEMCRALLFFRGRSTFPF